MSVKQSAVLKYVPGQIRELKRVNRKINKLQFDAYNLGQRMALDIIDGWSSGDELLDFVLVACNGNYDESVLDILYRQVSKLGLMHPGKQIIIIQKAFREENGWIEEIKNIHLATLRPGTVETDVDSLSLRFPVNPGHYIRKEFLIPGENLVITHDISSDIWIETGPLWSNHCDYGWPEREGESFLCVPKGAVCEIELMPVKDADYLCALHDIDSELLRHMLKTWLKLLSSL